MKAAPFDYVRAESIDEACAALRRDGPDAKLIAGGQSLVPMMAMRLTRPVRLIDIHDLAAMQYVRNDPSDVVIGACTRQCTVERAPDLTRRAPLLHAALRWVGHVQTRNRGTIGGSIAHADPAAELPLAACILDADIQIRSDEGVRRLAARDFFMGPLMTALESYECIECIRWPVWPERRTGCAFTEVSRRHGDFALMAAGAQVAIDDTGVCVRASLGLAGGASVPMAFPGLTGPLVGNVLSDDVLAAVGHAAAIELDPGGDLHASAGYRRHLAAALAQRVLQEARTKAEQCA